jgi:AmmeMemoRadiSam system protein A
MVLMSLDEFSESEREELKSIALSALSAAVLDNKLLSLAGTSSQLMLPGACFITLLKNNRLRGCIGTLDAYRPLAEDVAYNSYNAALRDPRFPAVESSELNDLALSISILTKPSEIVVDSEAQLLKEIRPSIDGIILQEGPHRATYLPSVWEQLPDAVDFIRELKCKAGLPPDYWSDSMKCFKYQSVTIQ